MTSYGGGGGGVYRVKHATKKQLERFCTCIHMLCNYKPLFVFVIRCVLRVHSS